jgi:CheY-like chemotaxis protein
MMDCPHPQPDYTCDPDSPSDRKTTTVLIVDDDEMLLAVMTEMLGFLGHQVVAADSGKKALTIYQKEGERIDLVLLDIMMPEMTGDVVFDRLKEMNPQVKVICLSGYCSKAVVQRMLAQGCCGYFPKPIDLKELACHIPRILQKEAARP